jgi:hypothetical protein
MRGGIAGTYNRSELLPERRAALETWASHVAFSAKASSGVIFRTVTSRFDADSLFMA